MQHLDFSWITSRCIFLKLDLFKVLFVSLYHGKSPSFTPIWENIYGNFISKRQTQASPSKRTFHQLVFFASFSKRNPTADGTGFINCWTGRTTSNLTSWSWSTAPKRQGFLGVLGRTFWWWTCYLKGSWAGLSNQQIFFAWLDALHFVKMGSWQQWWIFADQVHDLFKPLAAANWTSFFIQNSIGLFMFLPTWQTWAACQAASPMNTSTKLSRDFFKRCATLHDMRELGCKKLLPKTFMIIHVWYIYLHIAWI